MGKKAADLTVAKNVVDVSALSEKCKTLCGYRENGGVHTDDSLYCYGLKAYILSATTPVNWHDDKECVNEQWSVLLILATKPGTYVETQQVYEPDQPAGSVLILDIFSPHQLVMTEPYWVAVCCGFNKRVKMPTAKKLMRDTYKKLLAIVNNEAGGA